MADKAFIVHHNEVEEVSLDGPPAIVVGRTCSKENKRAPLCELYTKLGYQVVTTPKNPWPGDSFIQRDGIIIPEREFGDIGRGSMYVWGDEFAIASTNIKDSLEKMIKEEKNVSELFKGLHIFYVPHYRKWVNIDNEMTIGTGIALALAYDPKKGILLVDDNYLKRTEGARNAILNSLEQISTATPKKPLSMQIGSFEQHGNIPQTCWYHDGKDVKLIAHNIRQKHTDLFSFPLNVFTLPDGEIVANRGHNISYFNEIGVAVPKKRISEVVVTPVNGIGGIGRMTNYVPGIQVLDRLGIPYERFTAQTK